MRGTGQRFKCEVSNGERNTSVSNHTLKSLGWANLPHDVGPSLALNGSSEDKHRVAIKKILKYHDHFDVQPFFKWDMRVLPLMIDWFERAQFFASCPPYEYMVQIQRMKLSTIYDFIRGRPDVYIAAPRPRQKLTVGATRKKIRLDP